jgi:hypothetical protein
MGSCAMVYIQSFVKIDSGIQKLMEGEYADIQTHKHREQGFLKSLLLFFQKTKAG